MLICLFKGMTVKERSYHCWSKCHCFWKRNAGMLFPTASLLTIPEKAPCLQEIKCWYNPGPARHVVWDSSLAMTQGQGRTRPSSTHRARDGQAFLPIPSAPHPQSSPPTYPPDVKLLPTLLASERSTLWNPPKPWKTASVHPADQISHGS